LRTRSVLVGLTGANADVTAGISIVLRALETPIRQIAENAGVEGSIVVGKLTDSRDHDQGFDAQTETYVDMIKAASSTRRRSCGPLCRTPAQSRHF